MKLAIDESRKCRPEDDRIHPKVGAVLVKEGEVLASAYRGESAPGDHAEFAVLEKKLGEQSVNGATLYTTLEPCTARNHPKIPCADRLVERKLARVVIGMLDPNPAISGRGQRRLREANITTVLFTPALMAEVEDLNREFSRDQKEQNPIEFADAPFIGSYRDRPLDGWYQSINRIYWNRNLLRDASAIFAHLVEVVGGLSFLASSKKKPGVVPTAYIAKGIAWWIALCGKVGIKSVESLLWDKFPNVCPYCHEERHNPDVCSERKRAAPGPQWDVLAERGKAGERPGRLRDWQLMFSRIYPAQQTEDYGASFARLSEELGELAEAIRVFPAEPGYFLSEAADVFAWMMHIQNLIESKSETPSAKRGLAIEEALCRAYPDGCRDCGQRTCSCPPILSSTIGRIAHEVPKGRGGFGEHGRFMTPDKVAKRFSGL